MQSQVEMAQMQVCVIPPMELLAQLRGLQELKEYKPGWVTANYCDIIGEFPPKKWPVAVAPGEALLGWFKLKAKVHFIVRSINKKVAEQVKAWNEPWAVGDKTEPTEGGV